MYTVGLISKSTLRTFYYKSFEEADKEFKYWRNCFKKNNVVEASTTTIERNSADVITSIKTIFRVAHTYEDYTMFLSRSDN